MNALASTLKPLLTKAGLARLALGWGAFAALIAAGPALHGHLPGPALALLLAGIVAVILVCAFGVVHEAEHLAMRLGDPYGTLVLTLSIVLIEVVLIAAVLLGPGEHTTIARDSVMAVSMIILNLVIGASLLIGGLKHGGMAHNRTGTSAYLGLLILLSALAFGLPGLIGTDGAYTPAQEIPVITITVLLYGFFLWRQMGAQADDFREVDPRLAAQEQGHDGARTPFAVTFREHLGEILGRLALLVATVLPIVLLSHDMAALLDEGLARLGAPVALSGVLIALIVFLPESITSVRAALAGEIQRVSNLCHGALVSTVGLTIPAVLVISLLTGQHVVFAETPANLLLLGVSLLLSVATFGGKKVTAMHGAAHLALFGIYALVLFA
ncbi:calcium:proton antiporter [Galactobacter valiniphilus]|uniref:Calcium:proton antiporter n=1 Tax=Galactobacter valiniphilus TaxID=2676122 RepID=A0A399J9E5_9MICC|nr:calcium:proton antiporter [Galactobacter valiniphilus]RII42203.1 calcium:proton antiporter [Galactobacter valiniphilus]